MKKQEWWEIAFDEKYLKTYVDILSARDTRATVRFLLNTVGLANDMCVLDLACGHGRHAIALGKRGVRMTGLDRSAYFLARARRQARRAGVRMQFIEGDMRTFRFRAKFDAVINLFTSFGYFASQEEDTRVLRAVARALKRKGMFLIDLNNPFRMIARSERELKGKHRAGGLIASNSERLSNGILLRRTNRIDACTLVWHLERTWKENGAEKRYEGYVRLYTLPLITHLLEEAGLTPRAVWGGFDGQAYSFQSPRLIVLATKR